MDVYIATLTPPVDIERDHVRGGSGAPVTLVEYGDFQASRAELEEAIFIRSAPGDLDGGR